MDISWANLLLLFCSAVIFNLGAPPPVLSASISSPSHDWLAECLPVMSLSTCVSLTPPPSMALINEPHPRWFCSESETSDMDAIRGASATKASSEWWKKKIHWEDEGNDWRFSGATDMFAHDDYSSASQSSAVQQETLYLMNDLDSPNSKCKWVSLNCTSSWLDYDRLGR